MFYYDWEEDFVPKTLNKTLYMMPLYYDSNWDFLLIFVNLQAQRIF